jgi:anaerobic magnesium-protoporphyrin IX monomethyl ester cyclase
MKVMLVFPPQWTPAMPHLALPVLTSFLRSHRVDVVQRDLNLETYDAILSRQNLERAIDLLRQDHGRDVWRPSPISERVEWALAQGPGLAARIDQAKEVFRSPAFYDGQASLGAFECLVQALELASLPYYPARCDFLNYIPASPVDRSRSLLQAARDPRYNMFLEIFERVIMPDVEREKPTIVGISVPTMGQMLAAMTLAYLIRQTGMPCHITVGGPHICMLREQIPQVPELFDLIDSAVPFEGELPLLRLAETLDAGGDLAQVPNLIYKTGGAMRVNPISPQATAPSRLPDFDGLPLDRYLVPELVLPLVTSHGCYHGKCAFCNVGYGSARSFYQVPVDQVLDQITALQEKYGVRHIFFADEAITPHTSRELAAQLAGRGDPAPLDWCGCVRLERAFSQELLESMARGGCRMLLFGLESASERMIQRMVKGTQPSQMSRLLNASARAGIWNHVFFFFGFPGETMEDAQATVNFVYAHQHALHSASLGTFVLERYSPAHLHPEEFGIRRIIQKPDQDLAISFDYEVEAGLDDETAGTIVERLLDVLPTKRYGQYYVHDVYRFLYVSHLRAQGQPLPLWLADEERADT